MQSFPFSWTPYRCCKGVHFDHSRYPIFDSESHRCTPHPPFVWCVVVGFQSNLSSVPHHSSWTTVTLSNGLFAFPLAPSPNPSLFSPFCHAPWGPGPTTNHGTPRGPSRCEDRLKTVTDELFPPVPFSLLCYTGLARRFLCLLRPSGYDFFGLLTPFSPLSTPQSWIE